MITLKDDDLCRSSAILIDMSLAQSLTLELEDNLIESTGRVISGNDGSVWTGFGQTIQGPLVLINSSLLQNMQRKLLCGLGALLSY